MTVSMLSKTGHCAECGTHCRLGAQSRFCDEDCAQRGRQRQALQERAGHAACAYSACRSGQPIRLDGRFCSTQCRAHQLRIDAQRNQVIQAGLLAMVPIEKIMSEVNTLIYCEEEEGGKK